MELLIVNRKNNKPVRLEKVEEEDVLDLLNQDIIFKIKVYALIIIAMIIFLGICFMVQHQTYGFINW